jgi:hypothetical protein
MEREKFLKLFFNFYNRKMVNKSYGFFDTDNVKNLKSLTSLIDYNCQFKEGICDRKRTSSVKESDKMCCCAGCYDYLGFLKTITFDDLSVYTELFDESTGYWRKDGCSLPRELRSEVCLIFNCSSKITDAEKDLLNLISNTVKYAKEYKNKYNLLCSLSDINEHLRSRLEDK